MISRSSFEPYMYWIFKTLDLSTLENRQNKDFCYKLFFYFRPIEIRSLSVIIAFENLHKHIHYTKRSIYMRLKHIGSRYLQLTFPMLLLSKSNKVSKIEKFQIENSFIFCIYLNKDETLENTSLLSVKFPKRGFSNKGHS